MTRPLARLFAAVVILGAAAGVARPDPPAPPAAAGCEPAARYYVLLFGGHAVQRRPQTAHTWATFVKATPGPDGVQHVEPFTISWLPQTLKVRPYALRPEPGRNLTLAETMAFMKTGAHDLSVWGPLEIDADWHRQAAAYKAVLDSGAIRFQTLDRADRRPGVNHCVHAIAFTDDRLHDGVDPILWYGERITRKLADAADRAGLFPDPATTHDWLLPALGLDAGRDHLQRQQVGERVRRTR